MTIQRSFRWGRILLGILVAEALPIVALVLVVVVYGFTDRAESLPPEEFAPMAGNWVGPIGGFLATLLLSWWVAKGAPERGFAHGAFVGLGTAVLDFSIGLMANGGEAVPPLFYLSNVGRIVAGCVGGRLGARSSKPCTAEDEPTDRG